MAKYPKPRSDFDSDEEYFFYHWLLEAEEYGLVSGIRYHVMTYPLTDNVSVTREKQLKTKTKKVERHLLYPHEYTPDFWFRLNNTVLTQFFKTSKVLEWVQMVVDVKGTFTQNDGGRSFSINQKLMWEKYKTYVEKVVPEKLFKKTWVPEICRLSPKKRQPVKKYIGVPVISEFMENQRVAV